MATSKVIPKHLKPRIKMVRGFRINGHERILWECELNNESAVADTPTLAYRLFVWGHDGLSTTYRLQSLGLYPL